MTPRYWGCQDYGTYAKENGRLSRTSLRNFLIPQMVGPPSLWRPVDSITNLRCQVQSCGCCIDLIALCYVPTFSFQRWEGLFCAIIYWKSTTWFGFHRSSELTDLRFLKLEVLRPWGLKVPCVIHYETSTRLLEQWVEGYGIKCEVVCKVDKG